MLLGFKQSKGYKLMNTNQLKIKAMEKLIKAIETELKAERVKFVKELKACASVEAILDGWYYKSFLTPTKLRLAPFMGLGQLVDLIVLRYDIKSEKRRAEKIDRIKYIMTAKEVASIVINIEWKRSQTWGSNPSAEARVSYIDGTCEYFNSGSIGGCGYDKESTAVAKCLNQVNGVLKALYIKRAKNVKKTTREVFGYGSGYGLLPRIEGGVGVSCYPEIFKAVGFKFEGITHGKNFDVYQITKL